MHVGTGEQRQTDIEEHHHCHHIREEICHDECRNREQFEQHSRPSLYGLLYDFCSSILEFSVSFWLALGFLVAAISNALQKPGCGLMHNLVFLISSKNYLFLFLMYSSIAAAARLPAPIARITVAAPVTASPPANTPSLEVMPCSSSATMQPLRLVSRPGVV